MLIRAVNEALHDKLTRLANARLFKSRVKHLQIDKDFVQGRNGKGL